MPEYVATMSCSPTWKLCTELQLWLRTKMCMHPILLKPHCDEEPAPHLHAVPGVTYSKGTYNVHRQWGSWVVAICNQRTASHMNPHINPPEIGGLSGMLHGDCAPPPPHTHTHLWLMQMWKACLCMNVALSIYKMCSKKPGLHSCSSRTYLL